MDIDARSVGAERQYEMRRIAVTAILDGASHQATADLVGVTRQTVTEWMRLYREGGWDALQIKKRGRRKGQGRALAPHQIGNLCNTIKDKCPDQLKLFGCLWTAASVAALVKKRFGVSYSERHMQRLLKEWGYTPQKPIRRSYERNPEAVEAWLEKEYPAIKSRAKKENGLIYWEDETGARSDYHAGRTYGKRGKTPVIPDTGRRFGCNVISALTNRGDLKFMVFTGNFNADVFLKFLKRLVRQVDRKVFLIADGHPAHKAKKVRAWLEANKKKVEMFFLPPYCPELNPDEYLNNDLKQNAVGKKRSRTLGELVGNVRSHLRRRQKNPDIVKRFFQHDDVVYAA